MRVLLVSMPFGALERQALGLSLLKACLTRAHVACDVRYLTFDFAALVGAHDYVWVSHQLPYTAFAGDWCFTAALHGDDPGRQTRYVDEILRGTWQVADADVRRLLRVRALAPTFIDHCVTAIDWARYAVVGFTSTFEQNIASLALARRIKAAHPHLRIVFGGANWEGEMGTALHQHFPFVDYACSGEGERAFVDLVHHIGQGTDPVDVPGIIHRAHGPSVLAAPPQPIVDLDDLPLPDYTDYFHDLDASGVAADIVPVLLFESARGCWWGAKSHCTFCGLNGGAMAFRAKSQRRALDELQTLTSRWGTTMVEAVDNILDMRYFQDFLPAVAEADLGLQLFYEVKANLSRRHVAMLEAAGVRRIQPGIESMSDHVLALIRKGTTALQNVQLLKWCREYGVSAEWNLLYGFPGETPEDYASMLTWLPAIRFLGPPSAVGPLRLDRFSPYFDDAAAYGIDEIRALHSYSHLYPFDDAARRRIAYYFDYRHPSGAEPDAAARDVVAYVRDWQVHREPGELTAHRRADGDLVLQDTRRDATARQVVLGGLEQCAYEYCDRVQSVSSIERHLQARHGDIAFERNGLRGFLDSAVANRLMARMGDRYLSLALASGELRAHLERAEIERVPGARHGPFAGPERSRREERPLPSETGLASSRHAHAVVGSSA